MQEIIHNGRNRSPTLIVIPVPMPHLGALRERIACQHGKEIYYRKEREVWGSAICISGLLLQMKWSL